MEKHCEEGSDKTEKQITILCLLQRHRKKRQDTVALLSRVVQWQWLNK